MVLVAFSSSSKATPFKLRAQAVVFLQDLQSRASISFTSFGASWFVEEGNPPLSVTTCAGFSCLPPSHRVQFLG